MNWDKEREEEAARLWSEGFTGSQIADHLGGGLTRNAVIGKMHRMGIKSGNSPKSEPAPAPAMRA